MIDNKSKLKRDMDEAFDSVLLDVIDENMDFDSFKDYEESMLNMTYESIF